MELNLETADATPNLHNSAPTGLNIEQIRPIGRLMAVPKQ